MMTNPNFGKQLLCNLTGKELELSLVQLSQAACSLWAKKPKKGRDKQWLPLIMHMKDAAEVARLLWRDWLPDGTKRRIVCGLEKSTDDNVGFEDAGLSCFVFWLQY